MFFKLLVKSIFLIFSSVAQSIHIRKRIGVISNDTQKLIINITSSTKIATHRIVFKITEYLQTASFITKQISNCFAVPNLLSEEENKKGFVWDNHNKGFGLILIL